MSKAKINEAKEEFGEERRKFNHYIIELFNLKTIFFEDNKRLTDRIIEITKDLDLKILKNINHKYVPHGLTSIFILSSSHLIVHTWPEYNYLHIDLFTCSNIKKELLKVVHKAFNHDNIKLRKIEYAK